jgi:transposase
MRNSKELARRNEVAWRLMSVPGVGPGARLHRGDRDRGEIRRIRDIGTYLGLTERRYQSADNDLKWASGLAAKCDLRSKFILSRPFQVMWQDIATSGAVVTSSPRGI